MPGDELVGLAPVVHVLHHHDAPVGPAAAAAAAAAAGDAALLQQGHPGVDLVAGVRLVRVQVLFCKIRNEKLFRLMIDNDSKGNIERSTLAKFNFSDKWLGELQRLYTRIYR